MTAIYRYQHVMAVRSRSRLCYVVYRVFRSDCKVKLFYCRGITVLLKS